MEHPDPSRWWNNRRKGYHVGMSWAIIQTFLWACLELYRPTIIENMGVVIAWSYGISMTLIVSYYGNTAVEEFMRNRNT
jgi:hypothetical protein